MKQIINALTLIAIVAFGSLSSLNVGASPILGLFNTGDGISAGQLDTHYALSKSGGDGPAIGSNGYEGTNIHPNWFANSSASQWLTPLAVAQQTFDANSAGIYTWSLTFDLTGFDAASASFDGRWATDNSGVMKLNGTTLLNNSLGFSSWSSFSSTGGTFLSGQNTLDFIVTNFQQNGGNPTGLRVEFLNSDVSANVPEPATIALLGLSLFGLSFNRRKRLQ